MFWHKQYQQACGEMSALIYSWSGCKLAQMLWRTFWQCLLNKWFTTFQVRILPVRMYFYTWAWKCQLPHLFVIAKQWGGSTTQWKMYDYKFGGIKQRCKSGWVKHSVTQRISNGNVLLHWARRQWTTFLTSNGRGN